MSILDKHPAPWRASFFVVYDALDKFVCHCTAERSSQLVVDLAAELAANRDALRALYDVQNGPPLLREEKEWEEAMAKAREVLR